MKKSKLPEPRVVETVVSVPLLEAGSASRIQWAQDTARVELAELARAQDRDLVIDTITLVESGPHTWLPNKYWSFMFRATPEWRKGAKRGRRR